jgi:hypothetical protein
MMQLDFMGQAKMEPVLVGGQKEFWNEDYSVKKYPQTPSSVKYRDVEKFFQELDYTKVKDYSDYWAGVAPKGESEIFQRWLFAFMSVHTSWKANMAGYLAIKNWWTWLNKADTLLEAIDGSRVGMQNVRVRFISEFAQKYWQAPSNYQKKENETWPEFRDRLKHITLGLGPAKTSFALEMCYPTTAKLVCLDTHMFQAYGLDQTKDSKQYNKLEQHWVDMCSMWNVPPYVARCLYWDKKQGYTDSRYWSVVLEN